MKKFFWKDKSGRGFTNTFDSEIELTNAFEGNEENSKSYDDEDIWHFAHNAEVGDVWENAANRVERIE